MCAAKPKKILCDWMDLELTSGNILFLMFVLSFTINLFGIGHTYRFWTMGDAVSWATGGLIGYFICDFLLKYYDLWWWSF
jgi:hypothetical protein